MADRLRMVVGSDDAGFRFKEALKADSESNDRFDESSVAAEKVAAIDEYEHTTGA